VSGGGPRLVRIPCRFVNAICTCGSGGFLLREAHICHVTFPRGELTVVARLRIG
jgi:hypothetical protein